MDTTIIERIDEHLCKALKEVWLAQTLAHDIGMHIAADSLDEIALRIESLELGERSTEKSIIKPQADGLDNTTLYRPQRESTESALHSLDNPI